MASLSRVVLSLGLGAAVGCVAPTSFELRDSAVGVDLGLLEETAVDAGFAETSVDAGRDEALDVADVESDDRPDVVLSVDACPSEGTICGSECVLLLSDARHCGMCGRACSGDQTCTNGSCGCAPPFQLCGGQCVDPRSDVNHCGMCSNRCPQRFNSTPVCVSGSCNVRCIEGAGNCNVVLGDGCETNLANNHEHCGMCGRACSNREACVSGVCRPCGTRTTDLWCGTACVDTEARRDNDRNCGGCGVNCGSNRCCRSNGCVSLCL